MISYKTRISQERYPHLAIDLGYSRNKASCGIMYKGLILPMELQFGSAIKTVAQWVDQNNHCILVIEAVLSTFHDEHGNPDIRGNFEKGRGWYYGPGAVTFAAAVQFLRILRQQVASDVLIILAEAFLSFKKKRSRHFNDAMIIYNQFWNTQPEKLKEGTEPILDFIFGVPSVRVFYE